MKSIDSEKVVTDEVSAKLIDNLSVQLQHLREKAVEKATEEPSDLLSASSSSSNALNEQGKGISNSDSMKSIRRRPKFTESESEHGTDRSLSPHTSTRIKVESSAQPASDSTPQFSFPAPVSNPVLVSIFEPVPGPDPVPVIEERFFPARPSLSIGTEELRSESFSVSAFRLIGASVERAAQSRSMLHLLRAYGGGSVVESGLGDVSERISKADDYVVDRENGIGASRQTYRELSMLHALRSMESPEYPDSDL